MKVDMHPATFRARVPKVQRFSTSSARSWMTQEEINKRSPRSQHQVAEGTVKIKEDRAAVEVRALWSS